MSALLSTLNISILKLIGIEKYSECSVQLGGVSVATKIPSSVLPFSNVNLEEDPQLQVSITEESKELGRCMLRVGQLLKVDGLIDGEFVLSRTPTMKGESYTPKKVHLRIELTSPMKKKQNLKNMLQESHRSRKDLQMWIKESSEQFAKHHSEQSSLMKEALKELQEAKESVLSSENLNKLSASKTLKKKAKIVEFRHTISNSNAQVKKYAGIAQINESSRQLLEESWAERKKIQANYSASLTEYTSNSKEQDLQIAALNKENAILRERIIELEKALGECRCKNEDLEALVITLKSEIAILRSQLNMLLERKEREQELEDLLKIVEQSNKELQEALDSANENSRREIDKLMQHNNALQDEHKQALDVLHDVKTQHLTSQNENLALKNQHHDLKAGMVKLEEQLCVQEDLNSMVEQLSGQNTALQSSQKTMKKDLKRMKSTVQDHENTIKHARDAIESLDAENRAKENEVSQLKTVVNVLKNQEVYIPDKNDPVDIAVADYVNTSPSPIKVPFHREDPGIYDFGTKRVFVRLEHGKLIFRVGGGFLQIDDFLKVYSPVELEKFEQRLRGQAQEVRKSLYGKYADKLVTERDRHLTPAKSVSSLKEVGKTFSPFYAVQRKKSQSPARTCSARASY